MTIDVKELGMIHRFNGVDIMQSKHYVKLYNRTYINKMILKRHEWINNDERAKTTSTPMISDNDYQRKLEQAPTPSQEENFFLAFLSS